MPTVDRLMQGGVILRWHRIEGDSVGCGDDLCDIEFELPMSVFACSMEEKLAFLERGGTARNFVQAPATRSRPMILVARVTSSEEGVVREIRLREGSYGDVGSLLAVLSTQDKKNMLIEEAELRKASEFRVVANLVE